MKGTDLFIIVLFVSLVWVVTLTREISIVDKDKTAGSPVQSFSSHRATGDGRDLGGVTQRPGLSIHWAGSGAGAFEDSVGPIDVIEATIERIQHEQTTDLGSNANAMALIELIKARDALNGTIEKMPDGTTVIQ